MTISKYKNKKTTIDGISFDSKKESQRYLELKLMEKAGLIKDLKLQEKFVLIPKQKGERECSYFADFAYIDNKTGSLIVEDVKASRKYKTEVYRIKRKLMLYNYGIKIKEIY